MSRRQSTMVRMRQSRRWSTASGESVIIEPFERPQPPRRDPTHTPDEYFSIGIALQDFDVDADVSAQTVPANWGAPGAGDVPCIEDLIPRNAACHFDESYHFPNGILYLYDDTVELPDGSVMDRARAVRTAWGRPIPLCNGRYSLTDGTTLFPDLSIGYRNGVVHCADGAVECPDGSVCAAPPSAEPGPGPGDTDGPRARCFALSDGRELLPDLSIRDPQGVIHMTDGSVVRICIGAEIAWLDDDVGGRENVCVVHRVYDGGACAKAGVEDEDVLLEWNDLPLDGRGALLRAVDGSFPGEAVLLALQRGPDRMLKPLRIETAAADLDAPAAAGRGAPLRSRGAPRAAAVRPQGPALPQGAGPGPPLGLPRARSSSPVGPPGAGPAHAFGPARHPSFHLLPDLRPEPSPFQREHSAFGSWCSSSGQPSSPSNPPFTVGLSSPLRPDQCMSGLSSAISLVEPLASARSGALSAGIPFPKTPRRTATV